jgi:hypothetical protein
MELLVEYSLKYDNYYRQPIYDIFHLACGCVVAQQVSFAIGRNIRKALYDLCGFPLTKENILEHDLTQIKHLTQARITLLHEMAAIDDHSNILDKYYELKGFGPWSYGAVALLLGHKGINLSSDAYIRKNLGLYTGIKMTQKECYNYINTANGEESAICYFLWRIKCTGIMKLKNHEALTQNDFI